MNREKGIGGGTVSIPVIASNSFSTIALLREAVPASAYLQSYSKGTYAAVSAVTRKTALVTPPETVHESPR